MRKNQRQSLLVDFFKPSTSKDNNHPETPPKPKDDEDSDTETIQVKKRRRIEVFDNSSESEDDSRQKSEIVRKRPNKYEQKKKSAKKHKVEKTQNGKESSKEQKSKASSAPLDLSEILGKSEAPLEDDNDPDQLGKRFLHNTMDFLKPKNIMDNMKRKPDHPEYDNRTLFVPPSFLKNQTPGMRQWWEIKSKHFDTLLFFKVGKFYELYHMDAVVGCKELGCVYMKGEWAHCGFPESACGKMANLLIDKGYKVARIEQTETPEMLETRRKSQMGSAKDKVVKREVCQVYSKGAMVYNAQISESKNELPHYMYAISIKTLPDHTIQIGVCFIETSIGRIYLSHFVDDENYSNLLTLFIEYPVSLILIKKGEANQSFSKLVNTSLMNVKKEYLKPNTQFYTVTKTLEELESGCYFKDKEDNIRWPETLNKIKDYPKEKSEMALSSLGACMWYLKECSVDIHVISTASYEWYNFEQVDSKKLRSYMVLDSATIKNLNLLESNNSLKHVLDYCKTAFGKRLLHRWICKPLFAESKIKERQEALIELRNDYNLLKSLQDILVTLPDLERLLAKIRIYGNRSIATIHPDSRAILFEELTYSKKKIQDLIKIIQALENVQNIPQLFADVDSIFLKQITQCAPIGEFYDFGEIISFIKSAVNLEQAEKDGKMIPKRGYIEEFDEVETTIENLKNDLNDYLEKQCKLFRCKITYLNNNKNRYQLKIPAECVNKVPADYKLEGTDRSKKDNKFYSTAKTRTLVNEIVEAETRLQKLILDMNRYIFEKIGNNHKEMIKVIECLATLDVISSFVNYANNYSQDICVPKIMSASEKPQIIIKNGRSPCILNIDNFVPNDTDLGRDSANLLILTGPNMGGKSTLMRQVGIIAIMSHMGSMVPAESCEMTPIDCIFTRLGANDDIIEGQSTFSVELAETANILRFATSNSFVIIDELGRGTSTHDGNAIATAVVNKLTTVKCLTIFSTHYHSLVDIFERREDIQQGHMSCMEEKDKDDVTEESIIFLYKLAQGRCPKSYGFNVAKLAGLNRSVIARARTITSEYETRALNREKFINIFKNFLNFN